MTGDPASIDEVPWDDPLALEQWVRVNPNRVTPVVAERLLGHNGFVEAGDMPTRGRVRCGVWKPRGSERYPDLTILRVNVYYTDVLSTINLKLILAAIQGLRRWKAMTGIDL